MAVDLGSLILELQLDASKFEADLRRYQNMAVNTAKNIESLSKTISPKVDHSGLNSLNRHLSLKQQHWKRVQQDFSKPLQVKATVDFSQIDQLERRLNRLSTGVSVGVNVSGSVSSASQSNLADQIGRAVARHSRSSGGGIGGMVRGVATLPSRIIGGSVGKVAEGLVYGVTQEVSRNLGKGLSTALEKSISSGLGSTELVGEKIGGALATSISEGVKSKVKGIPEIIEKSIGNIQNRNLRRKTEALFESLKKIPNQVSENVIGTIGAENIVQEGLYQRGAARQRQQSRIPVARDQSADEWRKSILDRDRIEARANQRLQANAQKRQNIAPRIQQASAEVERLKQDLKTAEALESPAEEVSAIAKDLIKASASLRELSKTVEILNTQDQIAKRAISEARRKVKTGYSRLQAVAPQQQLPAYQNLVNSVAPGLDASRIPMIRVADASLKKAGAISQYDPARNAIEVTREMYEAIKSGTLNQKQIETLREELEHAVDFDFGSFQGIQASRNNQIVGNPVQYTQEEFEAIAPELGFYPEQRRALELNAKVKARRGVAESMQQQRQQYLLQTVPTLAANKPFVAARQQAFSNQLKQYESFAKTAGNDVSRAVQIYSAAFKQIQEQIDKLADEVLASSATIDVSGIEAITGKMSAYLKAFEDLNQRVLSAGEQQISEVVRLGRQDQGLGRAYVPTGVEGVEVEREFLDPNQDPFNIKPSLAGRVERGISTIQRRTAPVLSALGQGGRRLTQGMGVASYGVGMAAGEAYNAGVNILASPQAAALARQAGESGKALAQITVNAYRMAKGVESVTLALIPYGQQLKAITQHIALPAVAFGAATHMIPGGAQAGQMLLEGAQTAIAPLTHSAGSGLASQASEMIAGNLPKVMGIQGAVSGAITTAVESAVSGIGAAVAQGAAVLLGGKAIQSAGMLPAQMVGRMVSKRSNLASLPASPIPLSLPSTEKEMVALPASGQTSSIQVSKAKAEIAKQKKSVTEVANQVGQSAGKVAANIQSVAISAKTEADKLEAALSRLYQGMQKAMDEGNDAIVQAYGQQLKDFEKTSQEKINALINEARNAGEKGFGNPVLAQLGGIKGRLTQRQRTAQRALARYQPTDNEQVIDVDVESGEDLKAQQMLEFSRRGLNPNRATSEEDEKNLREVKKLLDDATQASDRYDAAMRKLMKTTNAAYEKSNQTVENKLTPDYDALNRQAEQSMSNADAAIRESEAGYNSRSDAALNNLQEQEEYRQAYAEMMGLDADSIEAMALPAMPKENKFFAALKGDLDNLLPKIPGLTKGFALAGGAIALLVATPILGWMKQLTQASIQAAIAFENLQARFDFTFGFQGAAQLDAISDSAIAMRANLTDTRQGFIDFANAVRDTPMEGIETQANQALSQMARVQQLSPEQVMRARVAITQMASKGGNIQSEEVKGQLAEALPGSTAIFARSLGMSVQEFNQQLRQGNVQAQDALPKFFAQLQAESSTGLESSLDTTSAAQQNLANQIQRLQEVAGKPLLPAFKMGVEALADTVERAANVLKGSLGIFEQFTNLFTDKGGAAGEFAATANKAMDEYLNKLDEVDKKQSGVNIGESLSKAGDFDLGIRSLKEFSKLIPEDIREKYNPLNPINSMFSQRAEQQRQRGQESAIGASNRILSEIDNQLGGDNIAKIQQINQQMRNLQTQRALLPASDGQGRREIDEQQRQLANQRIPLEADIRALSAQNTTAIETFKRLRDEAEAMGNTKAYQAYSQQLDLAQKKQEELNKAISNSVRSVEQLKAAFEGIQGALRENIQDIDIASSGVRTAIAANENLTIGQREFANLSASQSDLAAKIATTNASIAEQIALLNDVDTQRVLNAAGFDNNSRPSDVRERAATTSDEDTRERLEGAANQMQTIRDLRVESAQLTAQMAESQQQAQQRLIDLGREIADFNRQMARGAQDIQYAVEGLQLEAEFAKTKTRIESALGTFKNTFFDDLINGVSDLANLLNQLAQIPLQAKQQVQGIVNQQQDNALQAGQLGKQLPGGQQLGSATGNAVAEIALGREGTEFRAGVGEQCAEFVRDVFRQAGIELGVTSQPVDGLSTGEALANSFFGSDIGEIIRDPSKLLPGDIVGYANTYGNWDPGTITHVGVYAGNNEIIDRPTAARPVQRRALDTFDMEGFVAVRPRALMQQPVAMPPGANANTQTIDGSLFANGSRSLAARVIGVSEGTRTTDGGFTKDYGGHSDPGNGRRNQGSFSFQGEAWSPEEADIKWNQQLESVFGSFVNAARGAGLDPNNSRLAFNFLDLYTQAPLAATGRGGFLDRLPEIAQAGGTNEAILNARVKSYYDPDTGALDAPGFGNSLSALTADQQRRMGALEQGMQGVGVNTSSVATINPANAGQIQSGLSTFNSAANSQISAIGDNAVAQSDLVIAQVNNALKNYGRSIETSVLELDTSQIEATRRARRAEFDAVEQTPDIQLQRELFELKAQQEDLARDTGLLRVQRSSEGLEKAIEQLRQLREEAPEAAKANFDALISQAESALQRSKEAEGQITSAIEDQNSALKQQIQLKEEQFQRAQETRRFEARQATDQLQGQVADAQINRARNRQYDFGGLQNAALLDYQRKVAAANMQAEAQTRQIQEQMRMAGSDTELTAELEKQLALVGQLNEATLAGLRDEFDQTTASVQVSQAQTQRMIFDSGQAVLGERASGMRALGMDFSAGQIERQMGQGQINMDLQARMAEIQQMQAQGLPVEDAQILTENAQALADIKFDNLTNQFSAIGQLVPGISGAFSGFFSSLISGSASAEDAFKSLLSGIASQLADFGVKILMDQVLKGLLGGGGQSGGAGSAIGGIASTLIPIATSLIGGIGGGFAMGDMGLALGAGGGGGMFGLSSATMSMFSDGGIVGKDGKMAKNISEAMQREGVGAELLVAKKGELILSLPATREFFDRGLDKQLSNFRNGGIVGGKMPDSRNFEKPQSNNISISVNVDGGGRSSKTDNKETGNKLALELEAKILQVLSDQRRPGGILYG